MLRAGIVGLPNVGKSTLFNALTNAGALAANYPFATIEPNVGIVPVPDERLDVLAKMYETEIINIGRVTKVTKGGRHMRFSAVVVVGDRKGKVGLGTGKSNEVPEAIKKAVGVANKNINRTAYKYIFLRNI